MWQMEMTRGRERQQVSSVAPIYVVFAYVSFELTRSLKDVFKAVFCLNYMVVVFCVVCSTADRPCDCFSNMERLFKILIIGDPTVGKTSFVQRYVNDTFRRDYKGTIGVDFALKVVTWSDTETIKLQLWDIAGKVNNTATLL